VAFPCTDTSSHPDDFGKPRRAAVQKKRVGISPRHTDRLFLEEEESRHALGAWKTPTEPPFYRIVSACAVSTSEV